MHARLAETMDYVEDKRKELLRSFAGVPEDRLSRRASADGWTVAEIVDHLSIVEAGIARLITKRAARARRPGSAKRNRPNRSWLRSTNSAQHSMAP